MEFDQHTIACKISPYQFKDEKDWLSKCASFETLPCEQENAEARLTALTYMTGITLQRGHRFLVIKGGNRSIMNNMLWNIWFYTAFDKPEQLEFGEQCVQVYPSSPEKILASSES